MHKKIVFILFIAAIAQGCSWSIGKTDTIKTTQAHTTLGEELIALKEAFDSGAISEKEYDDLAQKITANRTGQ